MDLDARPLRCFVAVAEEQSFSRAAERLRLTQPTVSAQIRELERLVGFDLFQRTTRRVDLSQKGRMFLENARRMIDETDRLKRTIGSLRSPGKGHLTIGASFYMIDIPERIALIEGFIEAFPDISLTIESRWQSELLRDLHRGKIDLVLMVGMPVSRQELHEIVARREGSEVLYSDDLRQLVLRREPVRLLVPMEMPIASRPNVVPCALKGQQVAMLSPAHGERLFAPIMRVLERADAVPVYPPEPTGIGVERYGRQFRIPAISMGWFDNHLMDGISMVKRHVEGLDVTTDLVLVGHREPSHPAVEAFWELAQSKFASATLPN